MIGWILFGLLYGGIGILAAKTTKKYDPSVEWYRVARLPITWLPELIFFLLILKFG